MKMDENGIGGLSIGVSVDIQRTDGKLGPNFSNLKFPKILKTNLLEHHHTFAQMTEI